MSLIKTAEEIANLKSNGELVSKTLAEVAKNIKEGVQTLALDKIAFEFIKDNGAEPGFLNYGGFPNTLCISVNETVVHGLPSSYTLKNGDIVSIDCGTRMNGFYGDSAFTFAVGEVSSEKKELLDITQKSLDRAVLQVKQGNKIGDIGGEIQEWVESYGFSVVREMVGHGIGKNLHESPQVPNFGKRGSGKKMLSGMVICIEPMINLGKKEIYLCEDKFTIKTRDGLASAHFEKMVLVKENGAECLSTFDYIYDVLKTRS